MVGSRAANIQYANHLNHFTAYMVVAELKYNDIPRLTPSTKEGYSCQVRYTHTIIQHAPLSKYT